MLLLTTLTYKEVKCNRMLRSNHGISGIIQPLETLQHGETPLVRKLLDRQQT